MISLLNSTNWFAQYGLLIVLVVALVVLMLISFNRRKKEDSYRSELEQKVVPGAKIKTYYGLYGKVLKVTETTDGKILFIESGEGNKVSYHEIHINAVYAIDDKKEIVLDEDGNDITDKASEAKFEELERKLESLEQEKQINKADAEKSEVENKVEDQPKVEAKSAETKKPATKKTTVKKSTKTTSAKKQTNTEKKAD